MGVPPPLQLRYPILLTPNEKQIAQRVCAAFRHNVIGFNLLRSHTTSFVCDVDGWSIARR